MPKYMMVNENGAMIARLELESWIVPEHWDEGDKEPGRWPRAAVQSLIHLFTGRRSRLGEGEKMEIPEALAWHIAVLIDDWGRHREDGHWPIMEDAEDWEWSCGEPGAGYGHVRNAIAQETKEQGSPKNLIAYRMMERNVERARFITTHTRRWYQAGIELYAAALPEEKERWRSCAA